jgi:polar amino acid transport system substrate-binding protein
LGLIQLNDRQKGRFSAEQISLFERLAGNIANFLAKKKAEEELRASQERFRALYEYSPVSIWEVDFSAGKAYIDRLRQQEVVDFQAYFENHPDEVMACLGFVKILRANRESLRLFNLNSKDELSTYLPVFIIQESRGTIVNVMVDLAAGKTLVCGETTIGTRSEGLQELVFQLSVVPGCEATLSQVMISLWDITERKRVEVQLRDRIVERETLLRELYHRTKNNMQVIRSMLMLQSAGSTHPEVLSLVQEVDHKIQAMALVHQMLYQSNNLTSIDLEIYVRDLAHLAFSSYRPAPNQVTLSLSLEPILVTIDVATPLGLVVNELFSNAFKHAFLGGRQGEICIALARAEDGRISLKFADDGVGVPPGFDPRQQKTFGLTSVFALVEHQLNGRIKCDTRRGLAYTIEFADTPFPRQM